MFSGHKRNETKEFFNKNCDKGRRVKIFFSFFFFLYFKNVSNSILLIAQELDGSTRRVSPIKIDATSVRLQATFSLCFLLLVFLSITSYYNYTGTLQMKINGTIIFDPGL